MAARASHWGASDAAGLYLALGEEAEVPAPLVGSDALVAPRPATARSVTRHKELLDRIIVLEYSGTWVFITQLHIHTMRGNAHTST